jgi:transposase-like protein
MPRIRYSAAVRDHAVRLVLESQKPLTHVAGKFGCSVSTLQNWLKDYRQSASGNRQRVKDHKPKQGVKASKPGVKNSRQADSPSKRPDSKSGRHTVADKEVSPATFIPVNLIDQKSATVEIVTPDGFTLKLADANPQYIAELLGVLGSC